MSHAEEIALFPQVEEVSAKKTQWGMLPHYPKMRRRPERQARGSPLIQRASVNPFQARIPEGTCATPGARGIPPSGCLATTVVPGVPMLYFGGFAASLALVQTIGPIS